MAALRDGERDVASILKVRVVRVKLARPRGSFRKNRKSQIEKGKEGRSLFFAICDPAICDSGRTYTDDLVSDGYP